MKKPKKIKYKKIVFKLSEKQFKIVKRVCEINQMSPNKLFKKAIKDYIVHNYDFSSNNYEISENQLDLFDLVEEIEGNYELSDKEDDEEEG